MAMDLKAALRLTDEFTSPLRNAVRAFENIDRMVNDIDRSIRDMERTTRNAGDQMRRVGDQAGGSQADIARLENEIEEMRRELERASGGAGDLEGNLRDAGREGSSAADNIGGAFKKVAGILAAVFAVDQIKDFVGGAIEASAEAAATSAQFTEVFGDLEGEAGKRLAAIGDEATILENRMKGSFTKMAAFAKVGGMDTADSLDLADRSMRAIADSAAFYDRSLEDTTESLQSFLKGNFENDAALGLSATETTRNAAAVDLYGKKFIELDEAQKQLTLLQMVEDANKVSGAMGQAARESDGWENVMGNMTQAWTDFKAIVGVPFLELATKGIKWATDMLQNIDAQGIADRIGGMFSWIGDKISAASGVIETARRTFGALKDILSGENETTENIFWAWGLDPATFGPITEGIELIRTVFGALRDVMSGENETAENIFWAWGLSPESWGSVTSILESAKNYFNIVVDAYRQLGEFIMGMTPTIVKIFQDLWGILQPIFDALAIAFRVIGDVFSVVFNSIIMPLLKLVWGAFEVLWSIVNPILQLLGIAIKVTFGYLEWIWDNIVKPILKYIGDALTDLYEVAEPVLTGIKDFFEGVSDAISGAMDQVDDFVAGLKNVKIPDWITNGVSAAVDWLMPGAPDGSHYHGLNNVPYDGYTARLHKGETVLDRDEAKAYRSGKGGGVNVSVTGNTFHVRQDSDVDAIANKLAAKLIEAGELGA